MVALTYTQHGDYLLPNIILKDSVLKNQEPLTKYGLMRRNYLKNHRSIFYNRLLLTEELYPHCREIQQTAEERLEIMMAQLLKHDPPPDKATDNLAWAAHMNTLKYTAEELVVHELIYE